MKKVDRLKKLFAALQAGPDVSDVQSAWALISGQLATVEAIFAPAAETHMAVPALGGPYCKRLPEGGVWTGLLSHYLYINANGAFGVVAHGPRFEVSFSKPWAAGVPFFVAPEW